MKMEKEPMPETLCSFKKTDDRQIPLKEDHVT
jgi:hypothetical protein